MVHTLYKISDPYTKFWFKFIFPNKSLIKSNGKKCVLSMKIKPHFNEFVSWTFEDICIEYLKRKNSINGLPFIFEKIGKWWHGNEEIDILAIGQRDILIGECKWNENRKINLGVLKSLQSKSIKISNTSNMNIIYVLFSRNGFTTDLIKLSKTNNNIILIDLETLQEGFIY